MLKTGFEKIDSLLENGELKRGTVSVIGGHCGCGKTNVLVKLMNNLYRQGNNVLFITADETEDQIIKKSLSELVGISVNDFYNINKDILGEQMSDRQMVIKRFVHDEYSTQDIEEFIQKDDVKYDVVVADLYWYRKEDFQKLYEIAKKLNIVIISSHQLHRDCTTAVENIVKFVNNLEDVENVQLVLTLFPRQKTANVLKSDVSKKSKVVFENCTFDFEYLNIVIE